jgi:N-acetylglutamate synthase-like GNAT family acetyltransferase
MTEVFNVRVAIPEDFASVSALLEVSYPTLFAPGYASDVLAKALPLMIRANPRLLKSGNFYVALTSDGQYIACGGWSKERPGTGETEGSQGHVRHFATHPDWIRQGVGRAIFARCARDAIADGISSFECYSSLVAVEFYRALGFTIVRNMDLQLTEDVSIPGVLMRYEFADR